MRERDDLLEGVDQGPVGAAHGVGEQPRDAPLLGAGWEAGRGLVAVSLGAENELELAGVASMTSA